MKFRDLKLGWKLGTGFGAVLTLLSIVAIVGWAGAARLQGDINELIHHEVHGYQEAAAAQADFYRLRVAVNQTLNAGTNAERSKLLQELGKIEEDLAAQLAEEEGEENAGEEDEEHRQMAAIEEAARKAAAAYFVELRKFERAIAAGKLKDAENLAGGSMRRLATEEVHPALDLLLETFTKATEEMDAITTQNAQTVKTLLLVLTISAITVGILMAWVATRSVVAPAGQLVERLSTLESTCLTSLTASLKAISAGDFTVKASSATEPVPNPSKDELGHACETFNLMLAKIKDATADLNSARSSLSTTVGGIRESAEQVWSDSGRGSGVADAIKQVTSTIGETAHTSQEMASGSEALAQTASDAASSMENMDRSIEEVSALSIKVLDQASAAMDSSSRGKEAIGRLSGALDQISRQSSSSMEAVLVLGEQQEKIGAIVQAIEEIADQTNLLALNAAIEAARAGEHGRGFAVVADEVRKLAERAGSSTKEIANLIHEVRAGVERTHQEMTASVEAVEQGQEVGRLASASLADIAEAASLVKELSLDAQTRAKELAVSAQSVSGLVSQVASISEESAAGSEEISAGLHEVAASASQVSADLSTAAQRLNTLVKGFRIEGEAGLRLAA